LTGSTLSTDFPTVNAIQPTNHGGVTGDDAFVVEINAQGSALVYSTYLGGSKDDYGNGIAVDSSGNAYVTGSTFSTDFPTANPIQPTNNALMSAFVTKISAGGKALVYSTYLGGSGLSIAAFGGIAVDSTGNSYVTGGTNATDFPVVHSIQPPHNSGDGVVTKISADGSTLVYSTYLGGSADDSFCCIAVDFTGNAYISGATNSADFPTVNAIQSTHHGSVASYDSLVTEINAEGSALVYSTYLGGSKNDYGTGIAVDSAGSTYLTGSLFSKNFPITSLAFQQSFKGGPPPNATDSFVAKIASQTSVSFSPLKLTFTTQVIETTSVAKKLALTNKGTNALTINKIYVAGANAGDFAETNNCPPTLAAGGTCTIWVTFTPTAKNNRKAVLAISDSDPASPQAIALTGTGTVVSLSPKKLTFGNQPVGTTSVPKAVTLTNVGGTVLNFTGISITGTNAGDFSQTNTCGTGIGGGASCTITVTFKPTAKGSRSAAVSISYDGGGSPQKVSLTGTGT
jgi:hypothetical protein